MMATAGRPSTNNYSWSAFAEPTLDHRVGTRARAVFVVDTTRTIAVGPNVDATTEAHIANLRFARVREAS